MDLNHNLHTEAITPPTVQPNYNGRYTIWYGQAIWQWGVYHGASDTMRLTAYNSYEEVMRYLNPPRFNPRYWPFSFGRLQNQPPSGQLLPVPLEMATLSTLVVQPRQADPTSALPPVQSAISVRSRPTSMLVPTYVDQSTQPSPADNLHTPEDSPSTPEASPPLDEPPVRTHGKARKRRRRKRTSQASAELFFAETQPVESQSEATEQEHPSPQGGNPNPEDDEDHDPMEDIQVFAEHLVAISAHLEKSRTALLSSRMGVRFQQDFPRQLHRFLCSRGAETAIRDYLEHAEDPTYWRSRLVDEYYPDDNTQTFYPAMQLLRSAYQSYTTPGIRRPREVRPVQQLYDPDRTPYEPQHQVTRPAIKDEDKLMGKIHCNFSHLRTTEVLLMCTRVKARLARLG